MDDTDKMAEYLLWKRYVAEVSFLSLLTVCNRQNRQFTHAYLKEWSTDFQGERFLKLISTDFFSDS